jgi:hypothetical protein
VRTYTSLRFRLLLLEDTATGNSTSAVVGATQTAAAAFRVVAAVSDLTESNPDILVKFNPGGHQMTNNVGI